MPVADPAMVEHAESRTTRTSLRVLHPHQAAQPGRHSGQASVSTCKGGCSTGIVGSVGQCAHTLRDHPAGELATEAPALFLSFFFLK